MALSLLITLLTLATPPPLAPAAVGSKTVRDLGYTADDCKLGLKATPPRLTCTGHVKLWRSDLSLTCERLTAEFDAAGEITTAHCLGAVRVVTLQGTAQANEAHFDNTTQLALLTGKPKAQQGANVVEGRIMRLDVKTGEISVEGGVAGVISGVATRAAQHAPASASSPAAAP